MTGKQHFSFLTGAFLSWSVAWAGCTFSSPTLTCTGGAGASVTTGGNLGNTLASPYGANLTVSGAPAGTIVTAVSVTLNGVSADGTNGNTLGAAGFLLASPSSRYLEILHAVGNGDANDTFSNNTINIADGNPLAPGQTVTAKGTGQTFNWAPTSYADPNISSPNSATYGFYPSPAPPNGLPSASNVPQTLQSATFSSVFGGDNPNGSWIIYLVTDGAENSIAFTSWNITLTVSNATGTNTALTSGANPTFTSSPGNTTVLTATVTGGSGPTGSVTFADSGNNLTCSEGSQPRPLNSGTATCTASFSTEGFHALTSTYNPSGGFVESSGSVNQWVKNHSTLSNGSYCNSGPISVPGLANTSPYPSVINVGTDTPSISNALATLSLTLNNISTTAAGGLEGVHALLVAPGGNQAYEFLSFAGGTFALPSSNITFSDSAGARIPEGFASAPSGGNLSFQPASYDTTDTFPSPPSPAPQAPTTFQIAAPGGGSGANTFTTEFDGANANGDWLLFVYDDINTVVPISGGWCMTFTQASGAVTTTTVSGSPNRAPSGIPVTITASVVSAGGALTVFGGTVTFTENGQPVAGGPTGPVSVGIGVAFFTTSALSEGDHTIVATYNGIANESAISIGSYVQRIDNATPAPSVNGNVYTFCNTGAIVLPGPNNASNIGPASPNPSNIFISNLPGTTSAVQADLKGATLDVTNFTSAMLVGPAATTASTFVFFSDDGSGATSSTGTLSFADNASAPVPTSAIAPGTYLPTSEATGATYFASPSHFFTLPSGPYQYAAPAGAFTFNGPTTGVYSNSNAAGTWSLYFNQNTHDTGSSLANGWCLDLTQSLPDVQLTGTNSAQMTDSGNFAQGSSGSYAITVINNGPGATGGPPSTTVPEVTVTLDPTLSYASGSGGSNWTCPSTAPTGGTMTCTYGGLIASGVSFQVLTINVNISASAPSSVTSTAAFSGGGDGTPNDNTATRTTTLTSTPNLSITKAHNGSSFVPSVGGSYSITVRNAGQGATTSAVTVEDLLPSGLTFVSASGSGWSCGNSSGDVTCTSTTPIAANSSAGVITLTVAISTTQPTIQNTATLSGGGGAITTAQSTDTVKILLPAAVTSITSTSANGYYGVGASIPIVVTFSNPVTVNGGPQLILNSGHNVLANFTSGSGTNTLTFTYTVASGQATPQLDVTGISLMGGSIEDLNGSPATTTGTAGLLKANKILVIEAAPVTVVSFNVLFGTQGLYNVIGTTRNRLPWQITGIQVVFSVPIATANISSISGVTPTMFNGLNTNTLTWTISPLSIGTFSPSLSGLMDALGNGFSGSAYTQPVKVLWGDVNDDGVVNSTDLVQTNNATVASYNILFDVNGDGVVNSSDVLVVRSRLNTQLP